MEILELKKKGYKEAILPDGSIDWVIEVEGAPGTYLDYEGGYPYEEYELEFIDIDNYVEDKLKFLLSIYDKEGIIEILNRLH